MNEKSTSPAEQPEPLVAQTEAQRSALAQNIESGSQPLAGTGQGSAALRFIKSHPTWIIGGVVLVAALRPGRVGKWLRRGVIGWQIIQKLRGR